MSSLVTLSNGEKLAPNVYRAFLSLQAAVKAALNVTLWVSSGFRTAEEQERIFRARYRQQSSGNGPYGDVRWWNGVRWVRHSPDGTVAVPGTSLHEKASAVDFGGIPAGGGTALANWLRANAHRYGFSPTGYGFGEAWHYDFTGDPWAAPAGQERPTKQENDMGTLDRTEDNYQTFAYWLQRAFKFDVRTDGMGPNWRFGPTVFELLRAADDSAEVKNVGGAVSAIAVKMTDEDRAAIAKAVADGIKIPTGGATKADVQAAIDAGLAKLVLKPATQ